MIGAEYAFSQWLPLDLPFFSDVLFAVLEKPFAAGGNEETDIGLLLKLAMTLLNEHG